MCPFAKNLVIRIIVIVIHLALFVEAGAALAQPSIEKNRNFRIGVLLGGSAATSGRYVDTLRESLRALGYVDGQSIVIETRYALGDFGRMPALANELVDLKVNLIVATNEPALIAAKGTRTPIPIVAVACDPLDRLVGNLARPGGNATGVTCVSGDLVGKRLGYLKTLVPNLKRVAFLYSAADDIDSELRGAEQAGRVLGVTTVRFPVRTPEDFAVAFDSMLRQDCQALYISVSSFTNFHRQRFADLALTYRLPSIYGFPEFPEAGGLISYGATLSDAFKRVAYFVDRILKGVSPKDLPVEEPTKFYLIVNAKTAKALGIKIPDLILIQADTIIN